MSGHKTVYEFEAVTDAEVPRPVFAWLEAQALASSSRDGPWLRLTQRSGRRAVQMTSFVGVIQAPGGFQIEVLPKIGRDTTEVEARELLLHMLCSLRGFRHVQTANARLLARHMPLLEIFLAEFLRCVTDLLKRGLRSAYVSRSDNLFALRGKLLVSPHLCHNLVRRDRFFTEHDEFTTNRPENRLLHAALLRALGLAESEANQRLTRELLFAFADVPASSLPAHDFQQVRLERGMGLYSEALAWARLLLDDESPLTGSGRHDAPSLLFPMEAVFEAYVAAHLPKQLAPALALTAQANSHYLVRHLDQDWFQLRPDLLVRQQEDVRLVLDTKWKLLDARGSNGTDKYGLSQSDLYQLHAYGHTYLGGRGDLVLIYPATERFNAPLPVFEFPKPAGLRLWVLPFDLKKGRLVLDSTSALDSILRAS